ncbi:hypothetical protein [Vibrio stylophorae]|nr:hypothetical protein [Vibrio stylophorae]
MLKERIDDLTNAEITVRCNSMEHSYAVGSPTQVTFTQWLLSHNEGWERSPASYISDVEVFSGDINIKINERFVVVNRPKLQVIKAMPTTEIVEVLCSGT